MKLDFGQGTFVHDMIVNTQTLLRCLKGCMFLSANRCSFSSSTSRLDIVIDRMSSLITLAIVSSCDKQDSTVCIS